MLNNSSVLAAGEETKEFDLVINCVGYESRASFSLETKTVSAGRYISIVFDDEGIFSYRRNLEIMKNLETTFVAKNDVIKEYNLLPSLIMSMAEDRNIHIAVDISSMNRSVMASVLRSIAKASPVISSASLVYSPAAYRPPEYDYPQIDQIGPVIPELSGFNSPASLPTGLMIGLGYEFGIAAGILNRLEPKLTIAFRAVGSDARYEEAVRKANFDFSFGLAKCDVTEYSLLRPAETAAYVDNILSAMVRQYRCILIPMGPKPLSAIFILAGFKFFGQLAVWRVSETGKKPHDAVPDGRIIISNIDLQRAFPAQFHDELLKLHTLETISLSG